MEIHKAMRIKHFAEFAVVLVAVACLLLAAGSCHRTAEDIELEDNVEYLKSVVVSGQQSSPRPDSFTVDYYLDASCSSCIADFLSFLEAVSKVPQLRLVRCLIYEENMPLLEYYMSQIGVSGNSIVVMIVPRKYDVLSPEYNGNVIVKNNGDAVRQFYFMGNTFIEQ